MLYLESAAVIQSSLQNANGVDGCACSTQLKRVSTRSSIPNEGLRSGLTT